MFSYDKISHDFGRVVFSAEEFLLKSQNEFGNLSRQYCFERLVESGLSPFERENVHICLLGSLGDFKSRARRKGLHLYALLCDKECTSWQKALSKKESLPFNLSNPICSNQGEKNFGSSKCD